MRCSRTYFGHFTKRVRSRLGWMSPPRRKFLGAFSKRGFFLAAFLFSARGAEGSFLPPLAAFPIAASQLFGSTVCVESANLSYTA